MTHKPEHTTAARTHAGCCALAWPHRARCGSACVSRIACACRLRQWTGDGDARQRQLRHLSRHDSIDTNCTGCNAINSKGISVERFRAALANGESADVTWSVSGGDRNSGPGNISSSGLYTPPSYLTSDRVQVVVTATLASNQRTATSVLTVTPGFLQPLTPENAALGPNGQTTLTAFLAEAGGNNDVSFALANTTTGSSGGHGSLGPTHCQRSGQDFTSCTVTYSAPSAIASTAVTYVVATAGTSSSKVSAALLLNSSGVSSSPATHQAQIAMPVQLGASGGNNVDYDAQGNQIADCCGGTLGALVQDPAGRQYLLSNNHVLARSDHAGTGDAIVQPGLIDNNCTPNGDGAGTTPVGSLSTWLPLSAKTTNADAALAQVAFGAVDPSGSILELGVRQPDGTLAAAPPGVSSTGGKGEPAVLGKGLTHHEYEPANPNDHIKGYLSCTISAILCLSESFLLIYQSYSSQGRQLHLPRRNMDCQPGLACNESVIDPVGSNP